MGAFAHLILFFAAFELIVPLLLLIEAAEFWMEISLVVVARVGEVDYLLVRGLVQRFIDF